MKQLLTFLLFITSHSLWGQSDTTTRVQLDTIKQDTSEMECSHNKYIIRSSEYKKYKTETWNKQLRKYPDSKRAKEFFCEANYHIKNNEWLSAPHLLYCAYKIAKSKELKFQIIKTTQHAYSLIGDTSRANIWQSYVDRILKSNPDIDK